MDRVKTVALNLGLVAIVALVLMWGNTLYRQHAQFAKGEAAYGRGDFIAAVQGYESAIHMYTPGSSLVQRGAERLWELGQACERSGDIPRALIAYRSLRSSFYAAAGLNQPGREWIERCDGRIAELVRRGRS